MVALEATMDAEEFRVRREERRLATSSRHAAMAATPDEIVELNRVIEATETGVISIDDARSVVSQLRRNQQARRAA
jgi:Ca2+-binding EF-hand superfamily protein